MKTMNEIMFSKRSANLKRKAEDNELKGGVNLLKSAVKAKMPLIAKTQTVSDSGKCVLLDEENSIKRLGLSVVPQKAAVNVGVDYVSLPESLVDSNLERPSLTKTPRPAKTLNDNEGEYNEGVKVIEDNIKCLSTFLGSKTIKAVNIQDECPKLEIGKGQILGKHIINKTSYVTSTEPILEKSSTNLTSNPSKVEEDSDFTRRRTVVKKCFTTLADAAKQHVQDKMSSENVKPNASDLSSLNSSVKGFVAQPPRESPVLYIPRGPGNFSKVPFDFEIKQQVRYIPLKKGKVKSTQPLIIKRVGFSNLNSENKSLPLKNCVLLVDNGRTLTDGVKLDTDSKEVEPDSKQQSLKPNPTDSGDRNQNSKKVLVVGNKIVNLKTITARPGKLLTSKTPSSVPVISKIIGCIQKQNDSDRVPNANHEISDQLHKVTRPTVDRDTQTDIHCWLYKNNRLYLLEKDGWSSSVSVVPVEKASSVNVQTDFPSLNSPVSSIDENSLLDDTPDQADSSGNQSVVLYSSASEGSESKASFVSEIALQKDLLTTFRVCTQTASSSTLDKSTMSTTNLPVQSPINFPSQIQDSSFDPTSRLVQPHVISTSTSLPSQIQDLSANLPVQSKVVPTLPMNINTQARVLSNEPSYIQPRLESPTSEQLSFVTMNLQNTLTNGGTPLEKAFSKICNDIKTCWIEDDSGNIPLHQAVLNNDIIKLKSQCIVLQAIKSHLNHRNLAHETALMLAVKLARETGSEAVRVLVAEGADQTVADRDGSTPLHFAIRHGLTTVAEILLAGHDADRASQKFCSEGLAPLHLAAVGGQLEITLQLIRKGVDINIKDRKSGRTPYFLAVESRNIETAKLLTAFKANIAEPNFAGQIPHLLEGKSDIKSQTSPDKQMNLKKSLNLNDDYNNFISKKTKLQNEKVGKFKKLEKVFSFETDSNRISLNVRDNECVKQNHRGADPVQKNCTSPKKSLEHFSDFFVNSALRNDFADPYSDLSIKIIPIIPVNSAMDPFGSTNDEICENVRKSLDNNNQNSRPCVIQSVSQRDFETKNGGEARLNPDKNSLRKSNDHNFVSKSDLKVKQSELKNDGSNDLADCPPLTDLNSKISILEANSQSNVEQILLTDHSTSFEQVFKTTGTPSTSLGCEFGGDKNIIQQDQTSIIEGDAIFSTDNHKKVSLRSQNVEKSVETPSSHSEGELFDGELMHDDVDDESYEETVPLDYGSAETLSVVIGDCGLLSKSESPPFSFTETVEPLHSYSDRWAILEDNSSDNCESAHNSVQLTFNTYLDDIVNQSEESEPEINVKRASYRGIGTNKKTEGPNKNKFLGNGETSGITEGLEHKQRGRGSRTRGRGKSSDSPLQSTRGCPVIFPSSKHILTESQTKNQIHSATAFPRKSTRKRKT